MRGRKGEKESEKEDLCLIIRCYVPVLFVDVTHVSTYILLVARVLCVCVCVLVSYVFLLLLLCVDCGTSMCVRATLPVMIS